MPKQVITRFAPSPTGFLHVGSLRTALYAYLFAKKNKGEFLLRIEDTDQERKVEGAVENLQETLKSFGLPWDNKKLVVQSTRIEIYKKYAQQLIEEKKAYYCFCSKEKLEQLRQTQQQKGLPPMYNGSCRNLPAEEIKNNLQEKKPYVVRFKMPKTGTTQFLDIIRGKVIFDNKLIDDQVILKSDSFPTYHLANVVDDHEMAVTHVIRGEEWLSSTPKHILLYQAFSWLPPEFAHLPLLLNPDRSKLSKRQGDVAVEDYLKKGYLPEALLNFVLLLGWNPKTEQEIFSLQEMIDTFDLAKVNKSSAVFDVIKLDWLNGYYIRQMPLGKLAKACQGFFQQAGVNKELIYLKKVVAIEQGRLKKLADIAENTAFFFNQPQYDASLLSWKNAPLDQTRQNLNELYNFLDTLPEKKFSQKSLENEIKSFISQKKLTAGDILWPMRVALSGRKDSPGPFEIAGVVGKKEILNRVKYAISLLEK